MGFYLTNARENRRPYAAPQGPPRPADARPGHRCYSPELGRWANRDPVEETGGLNLYSGVANSPASKTDPLGTLVHESDPSFGLALGMCGEFKYYTAWKLDHAYEGNIIGGVIIQRMQVQRRIWDCNGNLLTNPKEWVPGHRYSEAWFVPPSEGRTVFYGEVPVTPGLDPGDTPINSLWADDLFGHEDQGRCTRGEVIKIGASAYFNNEHYPPGFVVGNVPEAGSLPSIEGWPAWPFIPATEPAGDEFHAKAIQVKWDCCVGRNPTILVYRR